MDTLDQSTGGPSGRAHSTERGPVLVRVIDAERPLAGTSSRHDLRGVRAIEIGRGEQVAVHRQGVRLQMILPDPRISVAHARITRDTRGFTIEDLGSKNGTLIAGRAIQRAALVDGNLIELGRTFLLFDEDATFEPHAAPDVDGVEATGADPEPTTLVGELAVELGRLTALAATTVPIVITGETGTGKEVIARAIHAWSRRPGALVPVNCGALVPTLIESELFGAKRGAFSGATEERIGLVRAADRGTLFLDEIGDLPLPSQAAFLRVLQEHEVVPVGGSQRIVVDLRLVAATHHSLEELVASGRFRRDLRARLTGFELRLPSVRERRADLGLLIRSILRRHAQPEVRFAPEALRVLLLHPWPDNVRELSHTLETAVALAKDGTIRLEHLPKQVTTPTAVHAPDEPLDAEDAQLKAQLVELLARHRGNVTAVARELGKQRMQIHRWMQRFGIDPDSYRTA